MGEREFEQMIGRLMSQDFSAGTEAFREELLVHCLAVLDADDGEACAEVGDDDLELLAAAGTVYANPSAGSGRLSREAHL